MEFYFSDANLQKDRFLKQQMDLQEEKCKLYFVAAIVMSVWSQLCIDSHLKFGWFYSNLLLKLV